MKFIPNYTCLHRNRNIFDRVLAMKLTSHKAKYGFFSFLISVVPLTLDTLDPFSKNGWNWNVVSATRTELQPSKQRR